MKYIPSGTRVEHCAISALLLPAFGGMLYGWDIGSTSSALKSLMNSETCANLCLEQSSKQGIFVSSTLAGAFVASGFTSLGLCETFGRKQELLLAVSLYFLGAIWQGLAPTYHLLIQGRVVYGLGIGFAMHGAPVYISEIAPEVIRGRLMALKECFIVGGILAGYIGGQLVNGKVSGWRTLLSTSSLVSGSLLLFARKFPESPRWLIQRGQIFAARETLRNLRGINFPSNELDLEIENMDSTLAQASIGVREDRFGLRKSLTIALSMVFFQQATGQPTVLYYAEQTFVDAGLTNASAMMSIILGCVKLCMTGFSAAYVDRLGRRPLMLYGIACSVASLCILAIFSGEKSFHDNSEATFMLLKGTHMSIVAVFTYVMAYQISFGPLTWLIVGEIFSQHVRGFATGMVTLVNFLLNFILAASIPTLLEYYGRDRMYFFFALMGIIAFFTIYFILPETRGRTLERITQMMHS